MFSPTESDRVQMGVPGTPRSRTMPRKTLSPSELGQTSPLPKNPDLQEVPLGSAIWLLSISLSIQRWEFQEETGQGVVVTEGG